MNQDNVRQQVMVELAVLFLILVGLGNYYCREIVSKNFASTTSEFNLHENLLPKNAAVVLAGQRFHLNQADYRDLLTLPGVGPGMAHAILRARNVQHGFRSLDELSEIRGLGPKKLKTFEPFLTF